LDSVSFEVRRGEVFGFLGRNGAGKSTTIKILSTLLLPSEGHAIVLDHDTARDGQEIRKRIGLVQQALSYEFSLTMERQLDLYGRIWGLSHSERLAKTKYLIDKFELKDSIGKTPYQMSIGQRRRMQIARELMHVMDLLFIYEPTSGLDVQTRRLTLDLFREKAKVGLTIFLTTHILQEAEYMCDRVGIIDRGRIVAVDSVDALKSKHAKEHTLELMANPISEAASVLGKIDNLGQISPISTGDSTIRVPFSSSDHQTVISEIVSALTQQGISIQRIGMVEPTLEDVFIGLTARVN